ncbi:hypothetical protein CKF54_06130 [Psittacicella hinzii]|uniref:Uncharacterized protein n=1 Tax=Psittacicella hinzii TaxID=2028575 RepID=A0A3A1Y2U0_9GAMM|nr:SIR2 family protein [Psittacicella hinzii]RIY31761.1 hypothetical protein CKF54_06130 [Psittacicella hinzii]
MKILFNSPRLSSGKYNNIDDFVRDNKIELDPQVEILPVYRASFRSPEWIDKVVHFSLDGQDYSMSKEDDEKLRRSNNGKKLLSRYLHDKFQLNNVVVLAGSGMSMSLNNSTQDETSEYNFLAPSMTDLWIAATKWEYLHKTEEFEKVVTIKDICEILEMEYKDDKILNIEDFLSLCNGYCQFRTSKADFLHYVKTFKDYIVKEIIRLTNFVDKVPEENWRAHTNFLRKLCSYRQKDKDDNERLKVFTTNYDMAIEVAASKNEFIVLDGFKVFPPHRFSPHNIYNLDFYNKRKSINGNIVRAEDVIYLYKIHGSVNWYKNDKGEIFKDSKVDLSRFETNSNITPLIVCPSKDKYEETNDSPYNEMMDYFKDSLSISNSVLICIGFGFNDKHINSVIKRSLEKNEDLSVIVVAPNLLEKQSSINPEMKELLLQYMCNSKDERIMFVDSTFGEFNGYMEELIN